MMLAIEPEPNSDRKRTIATLLGNSIELDPRISSDIEKYQITYKQHIGFPSESLSWLYKQWYNVPVVVSIDNVSDEYSAQQSTRNHLKIHTREVKYIRHLCKHANGAITKLTVILPPINNDCCFSVLRTTNITDLTITVRKNFKTAGLCKLIQHNLKRLAINNQIGDSELTDIVGSISCSAITHFSFTADASMLNSVLGIIDVPNLAIDVIGTTDTIISTMSQLQSLSVRFHNNINTLMNFVPLMRQTSDLKITFLVPPDTCPVDDTFIKSLSTLVRFVLPVTLAKSAITALALISLLNDHQLVHIDIPWPRDALTYPHVMIAAWHGGAIVCSSVLNALKHNYTLLSINNGYVPKVISRILKRNAAYTWQRIHAWLIEIAIIFSHLPPYVLGDIFDWSYMPMFPHVHGVKKINLIINIKKSIEALRSHTCDY